VPESDEGPTRRRSVAHRALRALFPDKRAAELAVDEIARRSPRYKCKPVISCGFGLIRRGFGWLDAVPVASRKLVAKPR
jgi:hypothetical protein